VDDLEDGGGERAFGGAKGGIICDPKRHVEERTGADDPAVASEILPIIGPDQDIPRRMSIRLQTMAWIMIRIP